jgi:tetratricopeptide (TPR) repeat protein
VSRAGAGSDSGVDLVFRDDPGDGGNETPVLLFAEQIVDGRAIAQTWDLQFSMGGEALQAVDRDAAVLWARDHLDALTDVGFIMTLSDTIWHNHNLDRPPGSFNDIIRFQYRILDIDPGLADVYSTIAWLLWSKWVTWTREPERMPDGDSKLEEALAVLERGAEANAQDAAYMYEAAKVLNPVVRFHRPDLSGTVIEYLLKAYSLEKEPQKQIRIRLDIAHQYRHAGNVAEAAEWYRRALEIDPQQPVACQYLKQLENAGTSAGE